MEAQPSDKPTLPFGRYVIREHMAQGGMGDVFRAVAVGADGFEKPVVIKRLLPQLAGRPEVASLLAAEAKLMTRLNHPNIVQVIDFGRGDKDDYFLVMELVTGTDLGRFCDDHAARGTRVSVPLALYIATQVLRGLAYAHASASADGKTLVHRDVSPGNVLLSTFGEVKVADFGVALVATRGAASRDEWLVGKPAYMAPEQIEHGDIDGRADIYGVGAVLFQTLTGSPHRPEPERRIDAVTPAELSSESLALLAGVADQELVAIVVRALAVRREERFADAREMARAIERFAQKSQLMASADDLAEAVSEVSRREVKRNRSVVVLSANAPVAISSGTELTRVGTEKDHNGFTLRLPDPPALGPSSSGNGKAAPASRLWIGLAVLLSAFGLTVAFLVRAEHPSSMTRSMPPYAPSSSVGPVGVVAPIEIAEAAATTSAAVDPKAEEGATTLRRPRSKDGRKTPAAAPEPTATCRGQIHLYAAHGWMLSGGVGTVQAPGRYDWPCGTYVLKAVSRLDPRDSRSMTVTIRETAPAVVDLR